MNFLKFVTAGKASCENCKYHRADQQTCAVTRCRNRLCAWTFRSEFVMDLFSRIVLCLLLASFWVECNSTDGIFHKCVSVKALPIRLRQLVNQVSLIPDLCKTSLTNDPRASQDLKVIAKLCFHIERSINYRYDVSRLGSQLECVGGKTGCATALLPKAV